MAREKAELWRDIRAAEQAEKEKDTKIQKAINDYVHQAIEDLFNGKSTPDKKIDIKLNI